MSKNKHTPGPWLLIDDSVMADPRSHIPDTMLGIATLQDHDGERPAYIQKANARLICAAPELLKALEAIADLYDTDEGCRSAPEYIAARAALAKARGES